MGRHSAPDGDDEDARAVVSPAPVVPASLAPASRPSPGRHAQPEKSARAPAVAPGERGPRGPQPRSTRAPVPPTAVDVIDEAREATAQVPAIVEPVGDEPTPSAVTHRNGSSATPTKAPSDLALLRTHTDVRARVLAAVLVPIGLYVLALLTIGSLRWHVVLIWIWLPLVTAGILAGIVLDSAHRAHDFQPGPEPAPEPAPEPVPGRRKVWRRPRLKIGRPR